MLAIEAVYITTDTLVSDPEDMRPTMHTTKLYPVPHWNGVICGTGIMQFIVGWYAYAVTSILARDIEHLDEFAPENMQTIFEKTKENFDDELLDDATSTIYHFGYSEKQSRFIGYAYRSTKDFVSEQLIEGFGQKPAPMDGGVEINNYPADFIALTELQKAEDEQKEIGERVGIGGEIYSFSMQNISEVEGQADILTQIRRCHRFDDFEKAYIEMCQKLPLS